MSTTSKLCPHCFLPDTSTQIAHWSFHGTLDDISANQVGPAVIVGSNVGLAFEDASRSQLEKGYIKIRNPGYLNIPNILLSNWSSGQWQFISTVDATGTLSSELRRNMQTDGSNPEQGLVAVTTAKPVPVGTWFDVAFSYDASKRTYSVYIDQQKSASRLLQAKGRESYQIRDKMHENNLSGPLAAVMGDDCSGHGTMLPGHDLWVVTGF
ncbi:hypothetical protein BDZ97DRAFT_1754810 [Flammula alnicola]|nr:hypothetical protein BDZ97DRAFT_1754810 [Flammula alnicola]